MSRVKVFNLTSYPDARVRKIVRAVMRDLDVDDVEVRVLWQLRGGVSVSGSYRAWWSPSRGEDRPVMVLRLPKPGVEIEPWHPYERKRDPAPTFSLDSWEEALVAIAAHEGMHHRQTPRHAFGYRRSDRKRKPVRYRENECDWAAFRAVRRWRGSEPAWVATVVRDEAIR